MEPTTRCGLELSPVDCLVWRQQVMFSPMAEQPAAGTTTHPLGSAVNLLPKHKTRLQRFLNLPLWPADLPPAKASAGLATQQPLLSRQQKGKGSWLLAAEPGITLSGTFEAPNLEPLARSHASQLLTQHDACSPRFLRRLTDCALAPP